VVKSHEFGNYHTVASRDIAKNELIFKYEKTQAHYFVTKCYAEKNFNKIEKFWFIHNAFNLTNHLY
jgi:hypothetical protein